MVLQIMIANSNYLLYHFILLHMKLIYESFKNEQSL